MNLLDADLCAVRRVCFGTADAILEAPRRQDLMVLDAGKLAVREPRLAVSVPDRLDMVLILERLAWVVFRPDCLVANSADLPDAAAGPYTQAVGQSAA